MTPAILRDFRTYSKHALLIKDQHGGRVLPLVLNPMQDVIEGAIDKARQEGRPPRIAILKPRRLGVSTGVGARFFFETATRKYQQGLVVAHRGNAVRKIFAIYERFWSNLPTIGGVNLKPKRVGARGAEMYYPDLDSGIYVESASGDIRAGEAQRVHLSELGFVKEPEELLAAVMPYVPKTPDSCVVIETSVERIPDVGLTLVADVPTTDVLATLSVFVEILPTRRVCPGTPFGRFGR